MYLTERLIAVSTYAVLLLGMYILISKSKIHSLKKLLGFYNVLLALMAFFFVPNPGSDLFRIIPTMNIYSEFDLISIWERAIVSSTPTELLYLYVIGKLKIDGMLPAITSLIFFRNVFYIFRKSAIKYQADMRDVALVLLLFMSSGIFFELISGIRTMLAFSIIAVCLYKELFENKAFASNILWYLFAILMHQAALAIFLIRLNFLIIQSNKFNYKKIIHLVGVIMVILLFITIGNRYFISTFDKAYRYFSNDSAYSYLWEYIIGAIYLFVLIGVLHKMRLLIKNKEDYMTPIHNLKRFSLILILINLISIIEYNTFHRLVLFNSIISITSLIYVLTNIKLLGYKAKHYKKTIFIISLLLLFLASARGNLSSLKFFIL